MNSIPIYSEEKSLEKKIKASRSVAYCTQVEPAQHIDKIKLPDKIKSSYQDSDLYFHQSILVTTNWNKNSDVFTPKEVWAARHTPEDKPNNLDHDELKIVGHMTGNFAIDSEGNLIDDTTPIDKLPSSFHILANDVIYKTWENDEQRKIVNELIEKIEAGEIFVSMECLLSDFDYILDNGNEQKILARNEQTSFLTKHLRSYGGDGEYNGYKLGRVLKGITFSGKGYTEKPANPDSIIFTKKDLFNFASATCIEHNNFFDKNGVSLYTKSNTNVDTNNKGLTMADEIFKAQAEKLEKQNEKLEAELADMKQRLAKADVEKYEKTIDKLKAEIDTLKEDIKTQKSLVSEADDKVSSLEKKLNESEESKAELQEKFEKLEKENIKANRVKDLVSAGVDKAKAEKKVDLYIDLDDKQFKSVAEDIVAASKKIETIRVEADDEKEDKAAEAAEVEDTDVKDDASLSVNASEINNDEEILKALASRLSSKMQYNKKNKGE